MSEVLNILALGIVALRAVVALAVRGERGSQRIIDVVRIPRGGGWRSPFAVSEVLN